MSKILKIYQLLKYQQLSTVFLVNGNIVPVTFGNGVTRPYLVRGRFTTTDPNMQAAIESDNSFNKEFYLERTETIDDDGKILLAPESVPVAEKEPEAKAEDKKEPDAEPPATEEKKVEEKKEAEITDYPEIINLQEARQKMFDLFPGEFKPANMPNRQAVINKAKAKNITFSKLA